MRLNVAGKESFSMKGIMLMLIFSLLGLYVFAQSPERPNILIIMTDQQTAEAMSAAGNKYLKTPAMDKLAKNGVRFTKAYCAQPLCTPSRSSIFSGKMPHETGFIGNAPEKDGQWPDSLLMMGKIFQNGGYQTGYVGKWHLPVPTSKVGQHGFKYIENTSFLDYNDAATPSFCARFIKENKDKPFLLVASFLNPHDICEWARGETLKMDVLANAPPVAECPPLPSNWRIPELEPKIVRDQQKTVGLRTYPSVGWTGDQWRQYRWAYNRLVEKVDGYIEMLLGSLQKYGVEKNTIIIFTADHGDGYAGHSWNQKQILYEESAKVPFIISKMDGSMKARTDDMLVCNGVDVIPTICGLAAVNKPGYLKGADLSKRMSNPSLSLRDTLVIETDFADNEELLGISGRAVITKDFKYIVYNQGILREQLFDLKKDPGEMHNLAKENASKNKLLKMRNHLKQWCTKNGDKFNSGL
ncbi:sulfatase-like hydrolase/transferase [Pedobacter ginsengiterrae]|uniref:Sulfatase-like hydrolase/transferase n=1 Tax=Pedobacter ginsengiterrae TaxID=871696 RepID=A0ABP7PH28_9SPHI